MEKAGLIMHGGFIVDATIIAAPSSTKNKDGKRDPEMHQTKKGNQWCHGMKAHVGAGAGNGYVHTITCTAANVHDVEETVNRVFVKMIRPAMAIPNIAKPKSDRKSETMSIYSRSIFEQMSDHPV